MKIVILCGGEGTRMKEETEFKPKPLVLVGGKPILWHIMKIYSHYGFNEFILALGYKGDMIKDYFLHRRTYLNNFSLDTKTGKTVFHNNQGDHFKITFVETGLKSLTGERIRQLKPFIKEDDFMVTYGDGVADINIKQLADFHRKQKSIGTISGVHPTTRFGILSVDKRGQKVVKFHQAGIVEKKNDPAEIRKSRRNHLSDFVNGGFMIFKKDIFKYIKPESMIEEAFVPLVDKGQLSVFEHTGQWKAMDTYKDVEEMNFFWQKDPFWKVWKE